MRISARSLAWFAAALLSFGAAISAGGPGCNSNAVGVDACRKIENERCSATLAANCSGATSDTVSSCQLFYRDQCLVGVQNTNQAPTDQQVADCIAAVDSVVACAQQGKAFVAQCADTNLVPANAVVALDTTVADCVPGKANGALAPCDFLNECVNALLGCSWVNTSYSGAGATTATVASVSATTTSATASSTGTGGAGGSGGATSSASSSSSSSSSSASSTASSGGAASSSASSSSSTAPSSTAASSSSSTGGAGGASTSSSSGAGGADAG